MLALQRPTPSIAVQRSRTQQCVRVVAQASLNKEQARQSSPVLMAAAMIVLTGSTLLSPMLAPPPALADEAADRRAAIMAQRKALLAQSRAKAEAGLAAPAKTTEDADAAVDRANAERARLAAERVADIEKARTAEYEKAAAAAVKEAPPV